MFIVIVVGHIVIVFGKPVTGTWRRTPSGPTKRLNKNTGKISLSFERPTREDLIKLDELHL